MWEIDTLKSLRLIVLVKSRNTTFTSEYVEKYRRTEAYVHSPQVHLALYIPRDYIQMYPVN
jgi:hypothetical protein